ncbi:MAG: hypothetical protein U0984_05625 [Prosthecobacter sp.]|nr:hypothetical protein [Prosthecobacter sp.]
MTFRAFLLLVFVCVFAGCNREPDLTALVAGPLKVTGYKDHALVWERTISPPSPEHDLLAAWAARNQSGWKGSLASYAPGTWKVTGTGFDLNILPDGVVLNIRGNSYIHEASESDFKFLSP